MHKLNNYETLFRTQRSTLDNIGRLESIKKQIDTMLTTNCLSTNNCTTRTKTKKTQYLLLVMFIITLVTFNLGLCSAHEQISTSLHHHHLGHQLNSESVHRFSNQYGTVLSCSDYLVSSFTQTSTSSSSSLSPPLILNGVQLDLRTMIRNYVINRRDQNDQQSSQHRQHHSPLMNRFNITIQWEVRPINNLYGRTPSSSGSSSSSSSGSTMGSMNVVNRQYDIAHDRANLRYSNSIDGTLSFTPFDQGSFVAEIHDAYYRCLLQLPQGSLASREIHVQAVVEKSYLLNGRSSSSSGSSKQSSSSSAKSSSSSYDEQELRYSYHIRSLNSSDVFEGNDAILNCDYDRANTLLEVSAWLRDDGKIYLPLEQLVESIKRSLGQTGNSGHPSIDTYVNYTALRHFILPGTGDLMVANVQFRDTKHRYRCQVRHTITNVRFYSQTWAYIRLKDISELYLTGPRPNTQLQQRHTVAVNEGESAFFYCSFDGHPSPSIEWFHTDMKSFGTQTSSSSSSSSQTSYFNSIPQFNPFMTQSGSTYSRYSWSSSDSSYSGSSEPYLYGKNFLTIERVSNEDMGIITCVANNSNSIVRHEIVLFVKSAIQVSVQATSTNPYPGQEITLSCNLSSNSALYPLLPIGAFSSSQSISSSSSTTNSDTSNPTIEEHNRRLRELISSKFLLNINWYHNGRPISYNHRKRRSAEESLVIADFRGPEDNGLYQCSVRLTAPDFEEDGFMAAQYIRTIERAPELTSVFTDQMKLVDKRDSLSLKCSAEGVPLPSIRWYLDGNELYTNSHVRIESFSDLPHNIPSMQSSLSSSSSSASSSSSSGSIKSHHLSRTIISYLNISSLLMQDIGMYECVATNYLGSVSHRSRINQMGSPFVKPIGNQTAILGQPYTINCTYGGYPLEEVYFIKGGGSGNSKMNNNNNKRMPFDERHLVPTIGSITINPIERSDQDYYRCIVLTSNGERAEQEFYLHVVVAPVVSPIVFSNNLEEGHRGSAVCTVTMGDSPIEITWFKDGILLRDQMDQQSSSSIHRSHSASMFNTGSDRIDHIKIVEINNFMSTLTIANISRQHQGLYTCVASSPIGVTNVSAFLSVRAAPQWRLRPADRNAIAGDSLTLNCQTSGQPSPVTRWKFLKNEAYHTEPIPILSSQQVHVLENGSLFLRSLEPKHSGIYICDASNSVNKVAYESRAHVTVTNLPKVNIQNTLIGTSSVNNNGGNLENVSGKGTIISSSTSSSSSSSSSSNNGGLFRGGNIERLVLRKGVQTQLMCSSIGADSPMTAEWLQPNQIGMLSSIEADHSSKTGGNGHESRIVLREETKLNERRAYLYISHVTRSDNGIYGCLATNINGHSIAFIELRVQEPPDMPVDFRPLEISSRTITLTWSVAFTGNAPITTFVVEYRDRSMNDPQSTSSSSSSSSGSSPVLSVSSENDIAGNQVNQVLTAKSLTSSITITGLSPMSTYEFRVCANNELGPSIFTDPLVLTTEMEAPSLVPSELRTLVLNSHSIKLIWSASLATPSEQIDGFYIGYRSLSSFDTSIDPSMSDQLTKQSSSSASSSMPSYTFKTMTQNMIINSTDQRDNDPFSLSKSSNMTTFCEVITRLGELVASSKHLNYKKKIDRVNQQFGNQRPILKREQIRCTYEFVVNSLNRKTRYGFIVQAFNEKGAGPTSSEVYAQTLMKDPPGKPYVRLHNVSSYEAAIVWNSGDTESIETNDPQSSPNSIDGYIISYRAITKRSFFDTTDMFADDLTEPKKSSSSSTNSWETISVSKKVNGYTLRQLRCGTTYRVRIEAFNEMGSGEPSDTLEFATLGRAPIAPNNNAFIVSNITFVMLDLDRWTTNGGLCPITHFAIRYRDKDLGQSSKQNDDSKHSWTTVSSHIKPEYGSMYIIRELRPGTWHELSVTASSEAGDTETKYHFATLTTVGATVEPLHFDGYDRRHLGSMIGGVMPSENFMEDPMILIPATCAILVLLVVGAATAFIFISRSKEALTNSEHFCRHRENSRSDQLSLNSFSKNYSKSDLMRPYDNTDKMTQIETLNCGQSDGLISTGASQYVDGPVAYLESKINDEPNLIEPISGTMMTPGRRVQVSNNNNNAKSSMQESFYSTPCLPVGGHLTNNVATSTGKSNSGYILNDKMVPFITATLRKQGSGSGAQCTSGINIDPRDEAIYGELLNRAAVAAQNSCQHPYYTHSLIPNPVSCNHENMGNNSKLPKADHVYELPKQQQLQLQQQQQQEQQQFDPKDANNIMMMVINQQQHQSQNQSSSSCFNKQPQQQSQTSQQSPLNRHQSNRPIDSMNVPNIRISNFSQNF